MNPLSPRFIKMPSGLDYSPREFLHGRRKNQLFDSYADHSDQASRQVALDKNNSTSGWQLYQRQMQNSGQRQDAGQSGYYSENSEFDSVSVTLVSTSKVSTTGEG